ncbi:MAG: hypothetical protein V1743_01265, partial [Nanoarchaeota archaeon]
RIKRFKQDCLVIAPHPYYCNPLLFFFKNSLHEKLKQNIDAFDAIEFSHFYWRAYNPNKKAVEIAKECQKTIIGNGDVHRLYQFNYTYSMIDAEKNIERIFSALRAGNVKLVTQELPFHTFLWLAILNMLSLT